MNTEQDIIDAINSFVRTSTVSKHALLDSLVNIADAIDLSIEGIEDGISDNQLVANEEQAERNHDDEGFCIMSEG